MEQILIRGLGYIYSLIVLPALAIIGVSYYRKHKTKGSVYFAFGAVATAVGSMFNKLFPLRLFLDETTYTLSPLGRALTNVALIIHLIGFMAMVVGWGIITFSKQNRVV